VGDSNPTTSTLTVPVAIGRLFNPDRPDGPGANVPTQVATNSPPDNVPVDPPMPAIGGDSNTAMVLVALGLMQQLQESGASVPSFANPLPPAFLLFGTALVGLSVLGRRRLKQR
jgi:hypothetical protein